MKVILMGFSGVREGDYQGRHWQNRQLFVQHLEPAKDVIGEQCEVLKIPVSVDISSLGIGQSCNVYFNRYGRVDSIIPCD